MKLKGSPRETRLHTAMSCAAIKRSHDIFSESPDKPVNPFFSKRCRVMNVPDAALHASPDGYQHRSPSRQRKPLTQCGPFVPRSEPESVEKFLPHTKRRRHHRERILMPLSRGGLAEDGGLASGQHRASQHGDVRASAEARLGAEQYFSYEEVKAIVERAVRDREEALSQEFVEVLEEKLTEQFHQFSKFNEDHIHRRLEASPFNYMS